MALNLATLVISIIVNIIVIAPALWIAGRILAGKKAKFTDALWIVVLGTVIGGISLFLFAGLGFIAPIIVLFIWLALVKHFFDTGWIRAFIIAVVAVLIWVVIAVIIGIILGVAIIGAGLL